MSLVSGIKLVNSAGYDQHLFGASGRMNIDEYFSWEWKELANKSCLYVAPQGTADNKRWIAFFEQVADSFPDGDAFVIVDVRGIEEKIDLEGFKGIIDILKRHGAESAHFAVITTDQFHKLTADIFQRLATASGFNLSIVVFLSEDSATDWLIEEIEKH